MIFEACEGVGVGIQRIDYTKMGWMKSYGVMIVVVLVGCGSVEERGVDFLGESEREWLRLVEEGKGGEGDREVSDINEDLLAWVTETGRSRERVRTSKKSGEGVLFLGRERSDDDKEVKGEGRGDRLRRIPREVEEVVGMKGVRVGVLLPMSGPLSGLGKSLWRASLLGLEAGDRGEKLSLLLYDTEGTWEGAEVAVRQAMDEGVDIVLGPLLSRSLEVVREGVRGRVPVLSFSNDSTQAEEGVYIFGYAPDQQVRSMVRYVLSQGKEEIAAVIPRTLYGKAVYDALQESALDYGLDLGHVLFYRGDDEDLRDRIKVFSGYHERRALWRQALREAEDGGEEEEVARLKNRETLGSPPFDSVFLVSGDDVMLRILSSQLSFFDVDKDHGVQVLGLQSWESFKGLGREPSLVGSWYVAPPDGGRRVFEAYYDEVFGEEALRLASLSYELVLLVGALEGEIRGGVDIMRSLERDTGFVGVEGHYRFRRTGRVERAMRVMRVGFRRVGVKEEAPETFFLIEREEERLRERGVEKEDVLGREG